MWGGVDTAWRRQGALLFCVLPLVPGPSTPCSVSPSLGLLFAFPPGWGGRQGRLWLRPGDMSEPRVTPALTLPPPSRKPREYSVGQGGVLGSRRCPDPSPTSGTGRFLDSLVGPGQHVLPQAPSPIRQTCPCILELRPCWWWCCHSAEHIRKVARA